MRSVLAIFRKDVRRLWPQIAIFLLLLPISAVVGTGSALKADDQEPLLSTVALLAAWYLIASVILQEPLSGDRHYWLGRPISPCHLLTEKSLFILLFVVFPVFLTQVVVLLMLGLSPWMHREALLLRQAFLLAQVILPAVALFAASRNLAQLLLTTLVTIALIIVPTRIFPDQFVLGLTAPVWFGPAAREVLLACLAGSAVVLFYLRVNPRLSWSLLAAGAALFFLVTQFQWDPAPKNLSVSLGAPAPRPRFALPGRAQVPIRIMGIPPNVETLAGRVRLSINGAALPDASLAGVAGDRASITVRLPENFPQTPVRLTGTLDLTLYQRVRSILVSSNSVTVPDVGRCEKHLVKDSRTLTVCLVTSTLTGLGAEQPDDSLHFLIPPGITDLPGSFASVFQPVDRIETAINLPGPLGNGRSAFVVSVRTLGVLRGLLDFPAIRFADYPEPE